VMLSTVTRVHADLRLNSDEKG